MNGTLYGMTGWGGSANLGTVFSISATGALNVIHSFLGHGDGAQPLDRLVYVDGLLYGTTYNGGTRGAGTVFSVDPTTGTEHVIVSFDGNKINESNGGFPFAGLIDVEGLLYGTTTGGGDYNKGTVFSINPTTGTEAVLHSFGTEKDGVKPSSRLVDVDGTLYGTTVAGGINQSGTLFSITKAGAVRVIQNVGPGYCWNDSINLINVGGTLYGTAGRCTYNNRGTVFSLSTIGTYKTLYSFEGAPTDAGCGSGAHRGLAPH